MSFVYTPAKAKILRAEIDMNAPDDFRLALLKVSGSTTADTEQDTEFLSGFSTIGEIVATNYARGALAGETVSQDDPNNRAEFTATNKLFAALGGASNDTIGAVLLFKFVTNDADSVPIAYIDNAGVSFAQATNGSDITVVFDAEGILQLT